MAKNMNEIIIAFGTETGNSESLSKSLAQRLRAAGHAPRVLELDEVDPGALSRAAAFFVITSTYGEGDPPSNAESFYADLMGNGYALGGLPFSVCALGDSDYEHFCKCGRDIDARLEALGGRRLAPRVDCDGEYQEPFERWWGALELALPRAGGGARAPQAPPPAQHVQAPPPPQRAQTQTPLPPPPPAPAPPPSAPARGEHARGTKRLPLFARVLESYNLNHPQSEKQTRHVSLSLQGAEVDYQVGDALGVLPRNDSTLVMEILSRARVDRNEKVLVDGELLSIYYVLKYRRDLVKIEPGLLDLVSPQVATGALRQALGSAQARKAYCDEHHVYDLLEHANLRLTAEQLAAQLRPLAPRLYSISSSPKAHPGEVHLTVDVLRYPLHGAERKGVASNFLAELEVGSHVGVYVNPTKDFTLCDPSAPVIMIGPGTGIAPFRAMLEERDATHAPGKSWLFFGAQRSALDFLYREQLEGWVRSGRLSQLDCAWSRDQDYKVYVQDLMYHHSHGLWRWLEAGAYVYVCGDAKRMAKDVHSTLLRILAEQGRLGEQGAEEYMSRLKAEKRYRRDVY